jgi:hypothetical protein
MQTNLSCHVSDVNNLVLEKSGNCAKIVRISNSVPSLRLNQDLMKECASAVKSRDRDVARRGLSKYRMTMSSLRVLDGRV